MAKIQKLSPHIANLIAAGEVVERPASVVKELIENAVDAGATQVTVEARNGGMTFLRVTDNGCGMSAEDARVAFLRHATSKLRTEKDLAAIGTMGFRGEALAAIASVSRIDLLTKTPDSLSGTGLHLEAGEILEESEAGCPDGTTLIVRDLFFNTPARMAFMHSDTVEGGKVSAAVQLQALAHPEVAFRYIREDKEVLSTPGTGRLQDTVYCIYGKSGGQMIPVDSTWEGYRVTGYVTRPTDARPSRALQTFFVNDRPVRSRILISALEEAYRNRLLQGKFPGCVLHLTLPLNAVDVNVHPAKTEVKFLNEKAAFHCIHYGVLAALNKAEDRPAVRFPSAPERVTPPTPKPEAKPISKQESFFRTMTPEEFKNFSAAVKDAPRPSPQAAIKTAAAVERTPLPPLREEIKLPTIHATVEKTVSAPPAPVAPPAVQAEPEIEQAELTMPDVQDWRYVGELYNCYILVEQGNDAFFIDKHAAHERILFEKLKTNQESISMQSLLSPISCRLSPDNVAILLDNRAQMETLGFELEEFGDNTLLVRQIPMDLEESQISDTLEALAADLQKGRTEKADTVRDELLHTVACKAAIKAGWQTSEEELMVLVKEVMSREDLKHCPHGRPICVSLSQKQLEKQFKRS
ncbi:MAG: DNA mismatch repair endonuclease MutL [Ruminococcaceae bacterium]|nr:DNA mismatch repair endonuclease MutL [Oscillospiraceae bacterium]